MRKSRDVLDAPEALLFHRGDQLAVAQEHRRDVAVVGVDAENVHVVDLLSRFRVFDAHVARVACHICGLLAAAVDA